MKISILLGLLPAIGLACSNGPGTDGGTTGGTTGGSDGGDGGLIVVTLDPNATGNGDIAMAIGPNDKVGVAYFTVLDQMGTGYDYTINYVEYKNGVVSAPSIVRTVQRPLGLTLAYMGDGTPAVGYLGGMNYVCNGGDAGCTPTGSTYWLESQAAIAYLQADGGWGENVCMQDSTAGGAFNVTGLPCVNPALMNRGAVVGLWPSLLFDGGTAMMVFRDVHDGQYPVQDWQASATKMCVGKPLSWSWAAPIADDNCSCANTRGAFGGHNQLIWGPNGSVAVVSDQMQNDQGEVFVGGHDVRFSMQRSDGTWTTAFNPFHAGCASTVDTIHDTQTGPVMAYSAATGFVVAVVDHSTDDLMYVASPDGLNWGQVQHVYNQGSGGWYPSIAVDPISGAPAVAFFICSLSPSATSCSPTDAQLVVKELVGSGWQDVLNVPGTQFYLPKLGYLSTGKSVIAYVQKSNNGASPIMLLEQP
jgi:hypothetical protein